VEERLPDRPANEAVELKKLVVLGWNMTFICDIR
jgi:hypothetical protein